MANSIAGKILAYIVLGAVAIGGIYIFFKVILEGWFGQEAFKRAAEQIATIWHEYDIEFIEFMENDETLDPNERAILDNKLQLLRPLIEGTANAIPNTERIVATMLIIGGGIIIFYKALKGDLNIGPRAADFINRIKPKADPNAGNEMVTFTTPEELTMIFDLTTIMHIADRGNMGLASRMLTAAENTYFTQTLPNMQAQYNLLASQLPYLTGMHLAMAQYMMTQYMYYLRWYPMTLPPLYFLPPILGLRGERYG